MALFSLCPEPNAVMIRRLRGWPAESRAGSQEPVLVLIDPATCLKGGSGIAERPTAGPGAKGPEDGSGKVDGVKTPWIRLTVFDQYDQRRDSGLRRRRQSDITILLSCCVSQAAPRGSSG